jgi:hypothetical protein
VKLRRPLLPESVAGGRATLPLVMTTIFLAGGRFPVYADWHAINGITIYSIPDFSG